MRIGLVPYAKPFMSPLLLAGPKNLELERVEIYKKLKSVVIDSAMSEWAAPLIFVA